ncbi:MAG: 2-amino-4-hydroxy-6-hydroxymethyldihydropteridine diphosphokinase [Planctomycetota bacterium]|nr:2-amino-4-hydroxy-6-hydroxymethyldihydropteridine diphosphokinase [Planctomycetota bacterium]
MRERRYEVLLSLGSNIDPDVHVPAALALLDARFAVSAVSARMTTEAFGTSTPQPAFVNLAVRARTDLPYRALREACRRIEEACGRRRTADKFAARTMDIDVAYGDPAFTATAGGGVPDPELLTRDYVLLPCAEIWPEAVHPETGRTLAAHAEEHRSVE